ncbi:hypothetical protein M404DRAFT_1008924 [Pisolithus tinctorius Marx 270]|uniref:Uncharacterized protein n=1 Tax=Pisolithus tinctorius Marx 270 TaxID=870435 RepID=A0A0C3I8M8_PISTI|nr:hypothetical protein M404DRAFT_1008924 [Pisolithus tinctorius Marx 270]
MHSTCIKFGCVHAKYNKIAIELTLRTFLNGKIRENIYNVLKDLNSLSAVRDPRKASTKPCVYDMLVMVKLVGPCMRKRGTMFCYGGLHCLLVKPGRDAHGRTVGNKITANTRSDCQRTQNAHQCKPLP